MLRKVYQIFGVQGNGSVGAAELLVLGQTRRKLGQKPGEWTHQHNAALMNKIGTDSAGNLPEENFVRYFDSNLPAERHNFDELVDQFVQCALENWTNKRHTKIAQRENMEFERKVCTHLC